MILGLVTPTSGEARIDGARFAELDAPGRVVGAVLEAQGFHPARSGRAHLRVAAAALGVPDRRVDEVLGLVGLADAAGRGGRRLVARHEAAPGAGHRAAGRPARAGPRRARQRPGPRGHRLAAGVPAGVRPAGPHGAGEQPPARGGRAGRRPSRRHRRRSLRLPGRAGAAPRCRDGRGCSSACPDPVRLAQALAAAGVVEIDTLPDGRLGVGGVDAARVGDVALAAGVAVHGLVEERVDLEQMFLQLVSGGRR